MIKPKIISVIACENLMKGTDGRISLLNVLRKHKAESMPVTFSSLYVYLHLGFGDGRMNLGMRIIDPTGDVHYTMPKTHEIYFDSPAEFNEIAITLPSMTFKHAGTYSLEFLVNEELLSADYHFEIFCVQAHF